MPRTVVVAPGILVALVGAAAADNTGMKVAVGADGDPQILKDLAVEVNVYDAHTFELIAGNTWEGDRDSPDVLKKSESRVNRAVDYFLVNVVVKYKGSILFDKDAWIRVEPGRRIIVEFDGQRVELSGRNSGYDGWPGLRVVETIDRKTVEATLKPEARIVNQEVKRVGPVVTERVIGFLYYVTGCVTVHDRRGTYKAYFDARVEESPASPLAAIWATLAAARRPFVAPPIVLRPSELDLSVSILWDVPLHSEAWARVILETPAGRYEFDTVRHPFTPRSLTIPPGPLRVRVELYDGRELKAAYEYEIEPERVILNLLGPRYVDLRIVPKRVPGSPCVRVEGWRFLHPDDYTPSTIAENTFLLETAAGTATFTLDLYFTGRTPFIPPAPEELVPYLTALSGVYLVRTLDTVLGVPDEVLYEPLTVPRLPAWYSLVGLGACLTALAVRHYLGPITLALLGVFVDEAAYAALPLALWGLRLIAAGTGLAPPAVGALAGLVQFAFDERESAVEYFWELPRLVLTTPPTWYLKRALEDVSTLLDCVLSWSIATTLPVPYGVLFYGMYWGWFGLPVLGTLQRLLEIIGELPLTGLTYAVLMVLPTLAFYPSLPGWLEGLLALPSGLAYLMTLLVTPAFLLGEPTTEFEVSVRVTPSQPASHASEPSNPTLATR